MKLDDVLTEAVRDISENGFTPERIAYWQDKLRRAASESMGPQSRVDEMLRDALQAVYRRLIENGQALKVHAGVSRFTLERVKPRLRAELDRRIMASANLIKLNKQQAVEKTLQRFAGWSTSIPPGGSRVVDKVDVKTDIRKSIRQLSFEERRVAIDQGHKLAASLNDIIATDGGAIAAIWHHHHVTYPRKEHLARDGKIFLIRGSWAHDKGLVKPGADGYTDQIEQPAEFVFCRCSYQYLYSLRKLPDEMITALGKEELLRVRGEIDRMRAA